MTPEERQQLESALRCYDRIIEREGAEPNDVRAQPGTTKLDAMRDLREMLAEHIAGRDYVAPGARSSIGCPCGWQVTTRAGKSEDVAHLRVLMSEHRKTCNVPERPLRFRSPEEWEALAEGWMTSSQEQQMFELCEWHPPRHE